MSAKFESRAIGRRRFLARAAGGLGTLLLAGCDRLSTTPSVSRLLDRAELISEFVQRLITGKLALAREFTEADISPDFKSNGTQEPDDDDYQALAAKGFADWRLEIGGLVEHPLSLSLDELRALPSRTQITRHDCVEGWSCIGKWKGAKLSTLLDRAGVKAEARYVVFFCADSMNAAGDKYYESIDLESAHHPQTILAYDMNDQVLPVPHGAPLRLRVERQLGYKMAKYIMRIELAASIDAIASGNGGYWEDQGYEWYAGI
jgi:DMSO/TMAO reductase YedYZ molybdopterin-dependent catalytic subunit